MIHDSNRNLKKCDNLLSSFCQSFLHKVTSSITCQLVYWVSSLMETIQALLGYGLRTYDNTRNPPGKPMQKLCQASRKPHCNATWKKTAHSAGGPNGKEPQLHPLTSRCLRCKEKLLIRQAALLTFSSKSTTATWGQQLAENYQQQNVGFHSKRCPAHDGLNYWT